MCTASWRRDAEGFTLWFNRDEQKSRASALPPRVLDVEGREVLAPVDPEGGGTWIFVNAAGLAACLLNRHQRDTRRITGRASRGRLLRKLARATNLPEFGRLLEHEVATTPYAACFLWAMSRTGGPHLWMWDGKLLNLLPAPDFPYITTSSFRPEDVLEARRSAYVRTCARPPHPSEEELESFHGWKVPGRSACSVFMDREDAWTVSVSRIRVMKDGAEMRYEPRDGPVSRSRLRISPPA